MSICKICGNSADNKTHTAREMMFGMREQFPYLECRQCGCVQLLELPRDMGKYYPKNYYSYQQHGWLMTALRHRWSAYAFGGKSLLGWFLSEFFFSNRAMMAVGRLGLGRQARILDVGCGSGRLLLDLQHLGFLNVTGVDPFIERDLVYPGGLTVYKKELAAMHGNYDVVMLHHSFEHMEEPAANMRAIARLLASNGIVVLRIPVASSYGWRHYGINWVHLDAPRHFYLHTDRSIELLSRQAKLKVSETIQEADEGTFWYSEAYARDISMYDPRFPVSTPLKKLLGWKQTQRYREQAAEINRRGEADMVCYILRQAELEKSLLRAEKQVFSGETKAV